MGPYGSVGAHIKTGESSMAQDHFKTPPDPKMAHKNPKMTQKSWLGLCWDNYRLEWEIWPKWTPPQLFIHLWWGVYLV